MVKCYAFRKLYELAVGCWLFAENNQSQQKTNTSKKHHILNYFQKTLYQRSSFSGSVLLQKQKNNALFL